MKNGFYSKRSLWTITLTFLMIITFSGCATIFELDREDNSADYDQGYQGRETSSDEYSTASEEQERAPKTDNRVDRAIRARDVVLGMSRQDVLTSWGKPNEVDVAGREEAGHERWVYGSRYSFNGSRTVIFENGKVAGWSR